ncbi:hypothetical protein [Thermomonospora amylolytica]|uniref:hypothetical protein n=1 Tax=Thermomonospora amylolytica TaxID=1411117 RepID=UPI000E6D3F36|nr:hypothetical protein [Thermomonospora amylolytica]
MPGEGERPAGEPHDDGGADADPIAGAAVAARRLADEVAAESGAIRSAMAEMAAVVATAPPRTPMNARPPSSFRAGRFGPARGDGRPDRNASG